MSPSGDNAAPRAPLGGWGKRVFDLVFGLAIFLPGLPIFLGVAALVWLRDGRPVFYLSRRMRAPGRVFWLIKFRTMAPGAADGAERVLGGASAARVTPLGRMLRRTRLDEVPQLLNVLRGDISFIGPRPPTPHYADLCPGIYGAVLRSKPGVTGLATLLCHRWEERLLSGLTDPAEIERVYVRRCIPRKARVDRLYQRKAGVALDAYLIWLTAGMVLPLPGRRIARLKARPGGGKPPTRRHVSPST